MMAQRFPADFDAIVSAVPVANYTGIYLASADFFGLEHKGGWINPEKIRTLKNAVNAACDKLDGLADGVISAYEKCLSVFDPKVIRCANGADTGDDCLSDREIEADRILHRPFAYPFPLAFGVTSFPGWTYGSEDQPGGMVDSVTGTVPPPFPLEIIKGQSVRWANFSGFIRYYVAQDAKFNPLTFSPERFRARLMEISDLFDTTNPDLSAFAGHGGKLIIKGNGADYQRSVMQEITYYKSVVAKMGQTRADQFIRFYVTPGVNHPGNGRLASGEPVPAKVDLLGVLDDWADQGKAPGELIQVTVTGGQHIVGGPSDSPGDLVFHAQMEFTPYSVTASRPMCLYPLFPRYDGKGDPKAAASFACSR
jgi:hypothetical protein